jgi:hypothetical protein
VLFQKITGLTAGAVSEIGEELVEAAHGKTQMGGEGFCEPVSARITRHGMLAQKSREW